MIFLWTLFKKNKAAFLWATLAALIGGSASAFLVSVISQSITGEAEPLADWTTFGFVLLVTVVAGFMARYAMIQLSERLVMKIRMDICQNILNLTYRRFEEIGRARLDSMFTQDTPAITAALSEAPRVLMNWVIIVGCLVYLAKVSAWGLLVFGLFLTVALLSYWIPESKAQRFLRRSRKAWDELIRYFNALNLGAKELRLHRARREEFLNRTLQDSADLVRSTSVTYHTIYAALSRWGDLLFFSFIGMILFLFPALGFAEQEKVSPFVVVLLYMIGPLNSVLSEISTFRTADVAFRRLREAGALSLDSSVGLDRVEEGDAVGSSRKPACVAPFTRLQCSKVRYSYYQAEEDRQFVLGPLDFTLEAGELTFIVGGNGSGKTTLAKILVGLYVPDEGEILLNGQQVNDQNRDVYRQSFSAIFSDFFLFDEILGLSVDSLDEKVSRYLELLRLEKKLQIRGGKLSTVELSQGQRKRLALLVTYLEDRPVYLFDEWAADQDPEFKEFFYCELLSEMKRAGKTVIVISHDDKYYSVADRILKLQDGELKAWEVNEWHLV